MSQNPPGYYKNNALTRALERVAEINAAHGIRAQGGGVPEGGFPTLTGGPAPLVTEYDPRNAPIGADDKPIPVMSNLDPDEQERRDREWAQQSGQRVGSLKDEDDDGIGGNYGTMDQGTPVRRAPRTVATTPVYYSPAKPAVLDFTKLQQVNFENGTVVIDGVGFKLDSEWLADVKSLAIQGVVSAIKSSLEKALLGVEEPSAATEDVQQVQAAEAVDGVSPAQPEA